MLHCPAHQTRHTAMGMPASGRDGGNSRGGLHPGASLRLIPLQDLALHGLALVSTLFLSSHKLVERFLIPLSSLFRREHFESMSAPEIGIQFLPPHDVLDVIEILHLEVVHVHCV